jgi:hypothetical protein
LAVDFLLVRVSDAGSGKSTNWQWHIVKASQANGVLTQINDNTTVCQIVRDKKKPRSSTCGATDNDVIEYILKSIPIERSWRRKLTIILGCGYDLAVMGKERLACLENAAASARFL